MAQVAALVLLVLGLLPIANWIPGGHDAPGYSQDLARWVWGGMIPLLIGLLATILMRGAPRLWRPGIWAGVARRWRSGGRAADTGIALLVFAVCALVSQLVLSARPLLIDEIIQLYQARIFASGRFWLPAPRITEFTSAMHLLDWNGKVFGQFPAGGPAMLAIGTLVHAEWLVGPAATAIGAFLFGRLLRRIELRDGTALAALLLYSFAPFTVFLGGSMMNHVTETTWLIAAALALAVATGSPAVHSPSAVDADSTATRGHPAAAFVMGLCLGIAATIRPTDAAAFALPAAAWMVWRARLGSPHFRALVASGVGVAIPVALLLYVNAQQTGSPFRFGYIEMWGRSHEIGFHQAPWGPPHTPARGLELINLYLLRLQDYFLETAGPSLLFATIALALSRRLRGFDRWIVTSSALLLAVYFAYWHDGFYLGPRFMLPLAPWLALWTARLPAMMEERHLPVLVVRGTVVAGCTALLMGASYWVPLRATQYRNGMLSMRFDISRVAEENGVHDAVVLVRESWGAQMMARLWGLGVSRMDADHVYRTTDACRLELAIGSVERSGGDSTELHRRLAAFPGDSARLRADPTLPDTTVRFVPGGPRAPVCVRRLQEDRGGFTVFPSVLLARGGGNVFLRDLHARDSLVLPRPRDRPVYLLLEDPAIGSPLRFVRIPVDSMVNEWRGD